MQRSRHAKELHGKHLINSFVLGNPHKSIFPAIYGATKIEDVSALGIIETYDATSIIVAADEAAKTAIVDLIELRIARGMCGKSYLMLTGDVAAVEAAIERAKAAVADRRNVSSILLLLHIPMPRFAKRFYKLQNDAIAAAGTAVFTCIAGRVQSSKRNLYGVSDREAV